MTPATPKPHSLTPAADLLAAEPLVDLALVRRVRLLELGLADDLDAALEWLELAKCDWHSSSRDEE
jgi:hypothetical protein